jgi:hypothetical protein
VEQTELVVHLIKEVSGGPSIFSVQLHQQVVVEEELRRNSRSSNVAFGNPWWIWWWRWWI